MLVEDDPDCLETMSDALSRDGHDVVAVPDGVEALQKLQNGFAPDLILLDLMLPKMDGWQFLRECIDEPTAANIPVVVVSGEANLRKRAAQLGVDYLEKPMSIEQLRSVIARTRADVS